MSAMIPKSSTVPELKGFLVEANEDDGYLYLTANCFEAAIQRKLTAGIESGGFFVLDAKMLVGILSHLAGDETCFEMESAGSVKITGESCTYTMNVLDGKTFPRPEIPFPDGTVKVSGIKKLYGKTSFGVVRSTYIINEEGIITHALYKVKPDENAEQVLALL